MGDLAGRKILVTGASRGLGAAVAAWAAERGGEIMGVGRSKPASALPDGARFLELDLSISDNVSKLVEHAAAFEPDTIVHCLGGGFGKSSDFISKADFIYLLNLNFLVALELNNSAIPSMIAKKRGWIVHLGSVATHELTASVGYTCVKSLVTPYVKHMGRKYAGDGVYFSGITLGAISGFDGAIDRLRTNRPGVYDNFIEQRRPTGRATPVSEVMPYLGLLLSESAKVHASNMICLDEAEGKAI